MKKTFLGALVTLCVLMAGVVPSFAGYYQGKVLAAGTLPGITNPCVFIRFGSLSTIGSSTDQRWYQLASSDVNRDLATALTAQAGDLWVQFWVDDANRNTNNAQITGFHILDSSFVNK